jgi:hypothetical protein
MYILVRSNDSSNKVEFGLNSTQFCSLKIEQKFESECCQFQIRIILFNGFIRQSLLYFDLGRGKYFKKLYFEEEFYM